MSPFNTVEKLVEVGKSLRSSLLRLAFPSILPRLHTKAMAAVTEASLKPVKDMAYVAEVANELHKAMLHPEGKK